MLKQLENGRQRCTYSCLARYLGVPRGKLITLLGERRPETSWIVNERTLRPTGFSQALEAPGLYDRQNVITDAAELKAFLLSTGDQPAQPKDFDDEGAVYGVDGCKGGWVYARVFEGTMTFGTVSTVAELLARTSPCAPVFIDIPIGLRNGSAEPRLCDVEARRVLAPRRQNSVFNAPVREILEETTFDAANGRSKKLTGKGISRQTFNIMRKIGEVDELLQQNEAARRRVREVHPEVCFWALAGGEPMRHYKKSAAALEERHRLIDRYLPGAVESLQMAYETFPPSRVSRDDLVDAAVAAITAVGQDRVQTLPIVPEIDSTGLQMEMAYRSPSAQAL
ncbi:DUF429 domain-containing protein [Pseudohaliea rubra]|uniref:DUF429 domain-containing protein n=1 Tax=Pseudohaliea rubra TaxID=475795 RepID=UPI00137863BB|nr:DUF429 domain-containing protein [Pseudohaliea rubra]